MDWVQTLWDTITGGLFGTVGVISMLPLYLYPAFVFLNAKVKVKRISLSEFNSKLLRQSYLSKMLVWFVMMAMFISLVLIPTCCVVLINLMPVITFVYLGYSAAMLSMEITSITTNYREIQQTTYVPILKRKSFWVLLITSALNVGRILLLEEIFLPSAAVVFIDAGSYGIITLAIFTMLFFDRTANAAKKYIKAAQKLTHILTTTVIKDEKQRVILNKKVDDVLELLYEVIDLSETGYIPDQEVQQVHKQIAVINELRADKGIQQKL